MFAVNQLHSSAPVEISEAPHKPAVNQHLKQCHCFFAIQITLFPFDHGFQQFSVQLSPPFELYGLPGNEPSQKAHYLTITTIQMRTAMVQMEGT